MTTKCTRCHHEWQAVRDPGVCDWCGAAGKKLANDYIEDDPDWMERALAAYKADGDMEGR